MRKNKLFISLVELFAFDVKSSMMPERAAKELRNLYFQVLLIGIFQMTVGRHRGQLTRMVQSSEFCVPLLLRPTMSSSSRARKDLIRSCLSAAFASCTRAYDAEFCFLEAAVPQNLRSLICPY